ncbi:MAG: hypothetical protein HY074_03990 [Deltaproteobacteria bacterium]|nr:hypothetical protein [Deltaproteobacteria bacterium]
MKTPLALLPVFLICAVAFAQTNVEFGKHADTDRPPSQAGEEEAKVIADIFKVMNPQKNGATKQVVTNTSKFTVRTCQIPVEAWVRFVVLGTPIHQSFTFKEGCDIQGVLDITRTPFPVDLQLRNYQEYVRVRMQIQMTLALDLATQQAQVSVRANDGILSTTIEPRSMEFSGDYQFAIGMDGRMADNKGGKLKVNRLKGKAAAITVPLVID